MVDDSEIQCRILQKWLGERYTRKLVSDRTFSELCFDIRVACFVTLNFSAILSLWHEGLGRTRNDGSPPSTPCGLEREERISVFSLVS